MLTTIKHNDTGNLVKAAQCLMGYKATGAYDADFVAYVCSWQGKHNLTSDGIIGPDTWTALASIAPTCSTAKNKTSAATCALQLLVGGLTADGVYGPKTKKAVAAYQSAKGLTADGICGPKTWAALIGVKESATPSTGAGQTVTGGKVINNCVHYLQWDAKWKNVKYSTHTSSQTIGNSGCGPSAMAQIMATFIDKSITPVEMAALAQANGFRTYSSGTAWGFYEFVFKKYDGFAKFVKTTSVPTLKAALKDGALAVCSMNSNDNKFWTAGGHFITAIGYDDSGYIYANDPNKKECPRKQKQDKFKSCLKQAFIFWPKKSATTPDKPEKEVTSPDVQPPEPEAAIDLDEVWKNTVEAESFILEPPAERAIIDISKHKGDIDFDTLSHHVSLVIPRASLGSDIDERFNEYAAEMNRLAIPMGVFCYSYAKDAPKGIDEAVKIVHYAKAYKPLFYVMDIEEECVTQVGIRAFATMLRQLGVKRVGAYVAHHLYKDYGFEELRSLFDFVWIPRYGLNNGTLEGSTMPKYRCDLWQYTSKGTIPGIKGDVDMNVITGDGHTLTWFLGGDD